jgi:hypothetical protein
MRSSDTLTQALDRLVADGTIEPTQAQAVRDEVRRLGGAAAYPVLPPTAAPAARGERVVAMLTYLGGALVMGAAIVIAAVLWNDLSQLSRIALCLGAGAVLLIVAALLTPPRGDGLPWHGDRWPESSLLAAFATGTIALAAGVAAEDLDNPLLAAGGAMAVAAVVVYVVWRGIPPVIAAFAATGLMLGWTIDTFEIYESAAGMASIVLAFGLAWALLGRLLPERLSTDLLGGLAIIMGLQTYAGWEHLAVIGLVAGLVYIGLAFALFLGDFGVHFAGLGGLAALMLPATALGTLTDSALAVGLTLLIIGLALVVGAVVVVRRGDEARDHVGRPDEARDDVGRRGEAQDDVHRGQSDDDLPTPGSPDDLPTPGYPDDLPTPSADDDRKHHRFGRGPRAGRPGGHAVA